MKDLPTWSDLNKGVRKMTDKEFEYCEEMEKRKHDDKLKELREVQLLSQHILDLQKDKGKLTDRVRELEQQIEKMKCCANCKNEGDYKEPYRYVTGWCNICKRHKVAKGNSDKWEIKEK